MPSRRKKPTTDILDAITPRESLDLLRALLKAHPALEDDARRLLIARISTVDRTAVAQQVVAAIDRLSFRDLSTRGSYQAYVEPQEGAGELLSETVRPFVAEMERLVSIGLEPAARSQCEGVVLGLYTLDTRSRDHDLLGLAEDFASEAAVDALARWLRAPGGPRRFDEALLQGELSKWAAWLGEALARWR